MKRITAVVLAAGPSRRFIEAGGGVKQLLLVEGESLVRRTARAAVASRVTQIVVVLGCEADAVGREVEDLDVEVVVNERFAEGQSSSVRAGLARVESAADGAIFLPSDQPFLDAETIDSILAAHAESGAGIVVPTSAGRRRAPVLFDRSLFAELDGLRGDAGGRQLFAEHAERIVEVELESELPLVDVDTPADYLELRDRGR